MSSVKRKKAFQEVSPSAISSKADSIEAAIAEGLQAVKDGAAYRAIS